MAELIDNKKVFSLLEVAQSIQRTLAERYTTLFWVKAEMNKLNHYTHSGHCYPELVEKRDGKVIALLKCNLWKTDHLRINEKFMSLLNEPLKDGINILFSATIGFDPTHGLSLRIVDIDPGFSLGELEREKQETIKKLTQEGIFYANKKLSLPLLPQRIAVISVETSNGYSDYLKVIDQNPWGYKIFNFLFPALLQGERSVPSIVNQLYQIRKVVRHFDAVAIIRGGGGDVGLSSYNNYQLAKAIALFPIPVFTGIGHSTNETVSEMVAFQNAITPTELADFLIQKFHNFSGPLADAERIIVERSKRILDDERKKFYGVVKYLRSVTANQLLTSGHALKNLTLSLTQESKFLIRQESRELLLQTSKIRSLSLSTISTENEKLRMTQDLLRRNATEFLEGRENQLGSLEKNISLLDPVNILKRGFSITRFNGKTIKNPDEIQAGARITTILADGTLESEVKKNKL
jgi:exodeoxyribonuclease VII large subunit